MGRSTWLRIAVLAAAVVLSSGLLVMLWNVSTPATKVIGPGISVEDQPSSAEPTPSPSPSPSPKKPKPSPTPSPSTSPPTPNNVITPLPPQRGGDDDDWDDDDWDDWDDDWDDDDD